MLESDLRRSASTNVMCRANIIRLGLTPIEYPTRTVVLPLQPIMPGDKLVYSINVRAGVSPHFYRVPFRVSLRLRERLIEYSDRHIRITPDWYVQTIVTNISDRVTSANWIRLRVPT